MAKIWDIGLNGPKCVPLRRYSWGETIIKTHEVNASSDTNGQKGRMVNDNQKFQTDINVWTLASN